MTRRLLLIGLLIGTARSTEAQGVRIPVGDLKPPQLTDSWTVLNTGLRETITVAERKVKADAVGQLLTSASTKTPPVCVAKTGTKCLTDGYAVTDYSMEWDAAAKLNLVLGSAAANAGKKVFVHDLMFTKADTDVTGSPITWGAGVRLVITATQTSGNASFSSLPAIAASAEFKYSTAAYDLRTVGLAGPKIGATIPKAGSYSIDTHVALMNAIDAIRDAASDTTTTVSPQMVAAVVRDNSFYIDRVSRDWAIQAILSGKSCLDAKRALMAGHSPQAEVSVESEYKQVAGRCDNRPVSDPVLLAQMRVAYGLAGVKIP